MIYLDNAASTPLDPEALGAMMPHLSRGFGNASSAHRSGREAARALRAARASVAALIGAEPSEIVFTSGGTESNNLALCGIARQHPRSHIVTSSIEHDSVLEPCARLEAEGHAVTRVAPDAGGIVDPADVIAAMTDTTRLVSVMMANNEVGTIQDVAPVAAECRARGAAFHTDAVQAAGKVRIDVRELGADLISVSAHKICGPKGAGALYVRRGVRLEPLVRGGGQERGARSGTENVAAIAGFGRACELARERLAGSAARVRAMRDRFVSRALRIPGSALNGDAERRLPGNAHLSFAGVSGEDLIIKLDEAGVMVSTGSACSVNTQKESHVLRAMRVAPELIEGSLRVTIGPQNTDGELDEALSSLESCVAELRRVSPLREKYGF